ncbi:ribbon-helix-helix protein, CopG family [Halobaculum sp. D14]|uniref:ribbon-helix-helix protein, CopG family n=1 Tax=Halobaculum sp. D14 TaxID=3421642 RepID=UPI003EBDA583
MSVDVPPESDEPCVDRVTVRLPRSTTEALQALVDDGVYPNRAAAIRAAIRLLLAREREGDARTRADADTTAGADTGTDADAGIDADAGFDSGR